ncbi:hypothetical protein BHM03_00061467, partial [Ensete ventricosum]
FHRFRPRTDFTIDFCPSTIATSTSEKLQPSDNFSQRALLQLRQPWHHLFRRNISPVKSPTSTPTPATSLVSGPANAPATLAPAVSDPTNAPANTAPANALGPTMAQGPAASC